MTHPELYSTLITLSTVKVDLKVIFIFARIYHIEFSDNYLWLLYRKLKFGVSVPFDTSVILPIYLKTTTIIYLLISRDHSLKIVPKSCNKETQDSIVLSDTNFTRNKCITTLSNEQKTKRFKSLKYNQVNSSRRAFFDQYKHFKHKISSKLKKGYCT